MTDKPRVSIVLPTFQGERFLKTTLCALNEQDFRPGFEIVAIDSESSDATVSLLKQAQARVFSIPQAQFGHGSTRNFGVQQARGDIIVFLSQDAVPVGPFWLRDLAAACANAQVGAVFARQLPRSDATPLERFFHATFYPAKARLSRRIEGQPLTLERVFFSNVCSAARREICERFPFDETLIMSEDQIFARDLLQAGYAIAYAAGVEVVHSHHYNLVTLMRRNFDSGHSLTQLPSQSSGHQLRRVVRFLGQEVAFLVRGRHFAWLLYLPFYEFVRFSALILGRFAPFLPRKIRVALSLHRAYWER